MLKRKKFDDHELQSLQDVMKRGGDTGIKDFEEKFQEVVLEGKRAKTTSAVHYNDSIDYHHPEGEYDEEELETLYIGAPCRNGILPLFPMSRNIF